MKKLLISMMATASMALVAQAVNYYNFTSFEGYQGNFNPNYGDDGSDNAQANEANFWTTASTDGVFEFVTVGVDDKNGIERNEKFKGEVDSTALSIDTDKALTRKINADGTPIEVPETGIYFDSMVKFTATDTEPTPDADAGDKLIVWLYDDETDDLSPELKITAATLSQVGNVIATTPFSTGVYINSDVWKRLTIVAKKEYYNGSKEAEVTRFEVYVDSKLVTTSSPLYSLVSIDKAPQSKQISSVSFEGTGVIDDLVWTTENPIVPPKFYTLDVSCKEGHDVDREALVELKYKDDKATDYVNVELDDLKVTVLDGTKTVAFQAIVEAGYGIEDGTKGLEPIYKGTVECYEWVKTVDVSSLASGESISLVLIEESVNSDEESKPFVVGDSTYSTLAEAIQAANGAVITLCDAAELNEVLNVEKTQDVVLDLKGFALTLKDGGDLNYSVVIKGKLTIRDTSTNNAGCVYVPGRFGFALPPDCGGGLSIESGTFIAETADYMIGAWGGIVNISGGIFEANYCVLNNFSDQAKSVVTAGRFTVRVTTPGEDKSAGVILGVKNSDISVSGGYFNIPLDGAFAAQDYAPTTQADDDGYYTVSEIKYPSVDVGDEEQPVTQELSEQAKNAIVTAFTKDGVYTPPDALKVVVNGEDLRGNAAIAMINEVADMFTGNPFTEDGTLEVSFTVVDVMAAMNGVAGGYNLTAGTATFNTEKYQVVPKYIDLATGNAREAAPAEGAVIFKLVIQKR